MKRPQHMTMCELIELPVLDDLDELAGLTDPASGPGTFGGAFQDDAGQLWRTLRGPSGWVRYPACLALLAEARRGAGRDERSMSKRRLVQGGSDRGFQPVMPARPAAGVVDALLRYVAFARGAKHDVAA